MRKNLKSFVTAVGFCAALALPAGVLGQGNAKQGHKARHHHYRVVDLGTLGGPQSFLNEEGAPQFPASSVLNRTGAVAAIGDTSTPDPFNPFCYGADCDVLYAFRWNDGVQTNLGVLPQNPAIGAQAPCLDCAWSSWAFWISDNGLVAGESETNTIDPLVGAPSSLAVLWKDGKVINLGTLGGMRVWQEQSMTVAK